MLGSWVAHKFGDWLSAFFGGFSLLPLLVRYRFSKPLTPSDPVETNPNLKVLLLARNMPFNGEVPRSLLCLVQSARGRGIDFSVASFQEASHRIADAFAGCGISPIHIGDVGYEAPTKRLAQLIQEQNFDVVMATSFKTYICAKAALRRRDVSGNRPDTQIILWLQGMRGALEGRIRRVLLTLLSQSDPMLFSSYAVKQTQLPAKHRGVSQVIYNGVQDLGDQPQPAVRDMRSNLGVPPTALTLAYTADFLGWKDHATTIAAVHELTRRGVEAHLLLIGAGPRINTARALAYAGPAAERIHFLGARSDIRRILPIVDIYVHASRGEGFASAVAEAMLAGRPIAAARDAVLVEYIRPDETGLLFRPGDPVDLADAVQKLAADRAWAATLGSAARQLGLTRFDVAAFAGGVCSFIEQAHPRAIRRRLQAEAMAARLRIGPVQSEPQTIAAAG